MVYPRYTSPTQYVKDKIKILERDFFIFPTASQIVYLKSLTTQEAIDRGCQAIILEAWGED